MDIINNKGNLYLYKYLPFNQNSLKILANLEFWLGSPDLLNDPFEGDFIIDNLEEFHNEEIINKLLTYYSNSLDTGLFDRLKFSIDEFSNKIHEFLNDKIIKRYGTTSFSMSCDCPRMWAHYADSHKGFAIAFDRKLLELQLTRQELELIVVRYNGLPHVTLCNNSDNIYINEENRLLKSKLAEWDTEKEVRLIKNGDFNSPHQRRVKFSKECIVGILHGGRMKIEDSLAINHILLPETTPGAYMDSKFKFYRALKNSSRDGIVFIPEWIVSNQSMS